MIAFVCHPYHRGGVTSWMKDAFAELLRRGCDARFISVDPTARIFGSGRPIMKEILDADTLLHYHATNVGYPFELGTLACRAKEYADLIKKYVPLGATLIPSDDEACWKGCCSLGADYKVLGVLHSDEEPYYRKLAIYSQFLAGYVCVSRRIQQHAAALPSLPSAVIPCGINVNEYDAGKKKDTGSIIWIGRIEEVQKRVSDIVLIASGLKERSVKFQIEAYGNGADQEWLSAKVRSAGVSDVVTLAGWANAATIRNALARSAILLQTSNFEGMSVAVMEALASGCMVVSSKVSGVEDLEHDPLAHDVVRLYDVGDVAAACHAIADCFDQTGTDIQSCARTLAVSKYGIDGCMTAYIAFIDKLQPRYKSLRKNILPAAGFRSFVLSTLRYWKWKLMVK